MERDVLENLVELGFSTAEIADALDNHPRIVAGWLREYGLFTKQTVRRRQNVIRPGSRKPGMCDRHGEVELVARGDGSWRCVACRSAHVSDARRRRKAQLVEEAGGCCVICGYDRCVAALEFHHADRARKSYGLAHRGAMRSLESMRTEAAKCVLLCSNCHAEVEQGLTAMPIKYAAG